MTCGFVKLCFSCNEWILNKVKWNDYCEDHLQMLKVLFISCNLFLYDETLVCLKYCLFCLKDSALLATACKCQFLDWERWRRHIDDHIIELDSCKAIKCSHSRLRCVKAFLSVLKIKFYLQDIHCIKFIKGVKRWRFSSKVKTMLAQRKRFKQTKDNNSNIKLNMWPQSTYAFVNEMTKLCGQHGFKTLIFLSISSQCSSLSDTSVMNKITDTIETLMSSVCTDIFDKLDPHLYNQ